MSRLTIPNKCNSLNKFQCKEVNELKAELQKYKDICTPEELEDLIGTLNVDDDESLALSALKDLVKLSKYEKLEADGRFIKLPCKLKLKQKWYYIGFEKPIEFEIVDFVWRNTDGLGACGYGCFPNTSKLFFPFTYWGEYVFKTKEEAEAKLKEMEDKA